MSIKIFIEIILIQILVSIFETLIVKKTLFYCIKNFTKRNLFVNDKGKYLSILIIAVNIFNLTKLRCTIIVFFLKNNNQ